MPSARTSFKRKDNPCDDPTYRRKHPDCAKYININSGGADSSKTRPIPPVGPVTPVPNPPGPGPGPGPTPVPGGGGGNIPGVWPALNPPLFPTARRPNNNGPFVEETQMRRRFIKSAISSGENIDDIMKEFEKMNKTARLAFKRIDTVHEDLGQKRDTQPKNAYSKEYLDKVGSKISSITKSITNPLDMDHKIVLSAMEEFTKKVIDKMHGLTPPEYQLNKSNLDQLDIHERMSHMSDYMDKLSQHLKDLNDVSKFSNRSTTSRQRFKDDFISNVTNLTDLDIDLKVNPPIPRPPPPAQPPHPSPQAPPHPPPAPPHPAPPAPRGVPTPFTQAQFQAPPGPPPADPPPGPPEDIPDTARALRLRGTGGDKPKPKSNVLTESEKAAFRKIKETMYSHSPETVKRFEDEMKKDKKAPLTKEFIESHFEDIIDKNIYKKINELDSAGKLKDASELKFEALKHQIKENTTGTQSLEHTRFNSEIESQHADMKKEQMMADKATQAAAQKTIDDAKKAVETAKTTIELKQKPKAIKKETLEEIDRRMGVAMNEIDRDKAHAEIVKQRAEAAADKAENEKKAVADKAENDKKAAADKAENEKKAAKAKQITKAPKQSDISQGLSDITEKLKVKVGAAADLAKQKADAAKGHIQDAADRLAQDTKDALNPKPNPVAKFSGAGLNTNVVMPPFGDDLVDNPDLAKAAKVVEVANHLGPPKPAQPTQPAGGQRLIPPKPPAEKKVDLVQRREESLQKMEKINNKLLYAKTPRQTQSALNEKTMETGNIYQIEREIAIFNKRTDLGDTTPIEHSAAAASAAELADRNRNAPAAPSQDSIIRERRLQAIRNVAPSTGLTPRPSPRAPDSSFDNPASVLLNDDALPDSYLDLPDDSYLDLPNDSYLDLPDTRPPSAPASLRPSSSTSTFSARGSFPNHPAGTLNLANVPAPLRPNQLDKITLGDRLKGAFKSSSARPAPKPSGPANRQSTSLRPGRAQVVPTNTISHNIGNTPSLHSTPLTPGVGNSGIAANGAHSAANVAARNAHSSGIVNTPRSGASRDTNIQGNRYSRISGGQTPFGRGRRLLPDLRFDPSRMTSAAKNAMNATSRQLGGAARGAVDYARSGMTMDNLKSVVKSSPENVASAVLGFYAYQGSQKLLDNVWKDKSDGAKFTKSLISAEAGNFIGTAGLYAGKSITPLLQSTFKAGSTLVKSGAGAALDTVKKSAADTATDFGKLMNMKSFGAMAGEFGMNVAKGGATVLLSMGAGEGVEQLMKASGVKSHMALEGVESLTEGVVGLGAMFAMDLLGGPVGALMAAGQLAMIGYSFFHGAQVDHQERVLRQLEKDRQQQDLAMERYDADMTYTAQKIFFRHYAEAGYDYDTTWKLATEDPEWNVTTERRKDLYRGIPTLPEERVAFFKVIDAHFNKEALLANPGPGGTAPTDRASMLYSKAYAHELAVRQVSDGAKDVVIPPALTDEETLFLNKNTNYTFEFSIQNQVEISTAANAYAAQQVGAAQQQLLNAWQTGSLTAEDMTDPTIMELARLDPNFEPFYRQAITLDAQRQIIQAFNTDSMLLDDLPEHLVDLAMSDGNFSEIYKNYTRKMVEMSDFYGISIQELAAKNNMTDEEVQALADNLKAEQDRQIAEVRAMNQQIVDKYNSKIAAQISAYGDDLPNVIRNLNDSLALSGRSEYVGMSATDLYNFLKTTAPDVTLNIPDPGPPFVYDPTKIIDTKPSKNYATESLSNVQKFEMKIRAERIGANITDADRLRIRYEVENPGREYVDENTRQNEIDNAQRLGISINAWRRLEDRRKAQEQKEIDILVAQRMGISVENLAEIKTVNTISTDPTRPPTYEQLKIMYPAEYKSYRGGSLLKYGETESAEQNTERMLRETHTNRIEQGTAPGLPNVYENIYEIPDNPIELQRENDIVDARNAADAAAADKAAADKAAADAAAAAAGENSGTQDTQQVQQPNP